MLSLLVLGASFLAPHQTRPYLVAARAAAVWLESVAVETEAGLAWPAVPTDPEARVANSLYSGGPGVVLFLLELADVTGEERWEHLARRGADELVATLEGSAPADAGLYTGLGGVAFALVEAGRLTGHEPYRAAAARALDGLAQRATREAGRGSERASFGAVTDVIAGDAGVGFLLLYTARALERPEDLELATALGRSLLGRADLVDDGGLPRFDWGMTPDSPRRMPNFSHGTAGIAAFLAALYGATGDDAFLSAALAGTREVLALADPEADGLRVYHHSPGGEALYYLGWCHGPVGTSRLFRILARVTGDWAWLEKVQRARRTVLAAGLPKRRSAGYWNNVGQCCGAAGVAGFLVDTGDLGLARELADDVLARATANDVAGERALSWLQAEHRVRPELLEAQTGYMQGAAGIGLFLLELDAALADRALAVRMPEDRAWLDARAR